MLDLFSYLNYKSVLILMGYFINIWLATLIAVARSKPSFNKFPIYFQCVLDPAIWYYSCLQWAEARHSSNILSILLLCVFSVHEQGLWTLNARIGFQRHSTVPQVMKSYLTPGTGRRKDPLGSGFSCSECSIVFCFWRTLIFQRFNCWTKTPQSLPLWDYSVNSCNLQSGLFLILILTFFPFQLHTFILPSFAFSFEKI